MKNKNIGCVIMASGLGVRFGGNKLMADFGGRPMVSWILEVATACFENVVVVTRNSGVVDLCNSKGVRVVYHEFPYRSDTIRLGIESFGECWREGHGKEGSESDIIDGALFCLADQPFLSLMTLRKIIENATSNPDSIWRSSYGDTIGSPVYFPKRFFGELATLPQDKGGSYVCKNHKEVVRLVEVGTLLELTDIDTRETYEELLPLAKSLGIWNQYLMSGKKHLFITGYRGAGKTTLINRVRQLVGDESAGLTSFAIKGVDVHLVNDKTKEEIIIGRYIPENHVKDNKMTPDLSVFDTVGVEFVESLINSSGDWVTIDEIGYLEEYADKYKDALRRLLDAKRVVAVVRKDDLEFLNELMSRGDVYVVALNNMKKI